jgi:hypothetical protein
MRNSLSNATSRTAEQSENPQIRDTVLGIRIRMFLGLPDPDTLVSGTDPNPSLFT